MNKKTPIKLWVYLKHGHSAYLAFCLAFFNFIVIQYRLVIQKHTLLKDSVEHLWLFALLFLIIYLPTATILGWLDYKKGSVPFAAGKNPYNKDIAKALYHISRDEGGKAEKILKRWIE